jgi:hypothetical protein
LLAVRPFSIFAFGESHNVSLIVRYASPIPIVLIFYSAVVFPMIPTAFGGGSMNAAEVFIKPDKEKALQRAGLSIGQNGSLGAWRIVAELPDAIVLTNRKLLFPPAPSRTIWVRKDDIEALIYVSAAKLAP